MFGVRDLVLAPNASVTAACKAPLAPASYDLTTAEVTPKLVTPTPIEID